MRKGGIQSHGNRWGAIAGGTPLCRATTNTSPAPKTSVKIYSSECKRQTLLIKNGKMEKFIRGKPPECVFPFFHFSIFQTFGNAQSRVMSTLCRPQATKKMEKWKIRYHNSTLSRVNVGPIFELTKPAKPKTCELLKPTKLFFLEVFPFVAIDSMVS
jgi:hypothetical protein